MGWALAKAIAGNSAGGLRDGRGRSRTVHRRQRRLARLEVWSELGTAPAASRADQARLHVRQPQIIRPAIRAQGHVVTAAAIDQDTADAHLAHLAQRDLDGPTVGAGRRDASGRTRHPAKNGADDAESNYRFRVGRNNAELLPVVAVDNNAASPRLRQRNAVDAQTRAALEGVDRGQIEDGGERGQKRHRPSALGADQNGRAVFRCTDHRQNAQGGRAP